MKILLTLLLITIFFTPLHAQVITGKVIDFSNGEPLEYVSIGVIGTPIGTITDNNGNFTINVTGQTLDSIVRVSMISYYHQIFNIKELSNKENIIRLISAPKQLAEVVIKPMGKTRNVGITGYTPPGAVWGWVGIDLGKGHETGTKLKLGTLPVKLMSLHIRVHHSSYDTVLVRLHVRNIADKMPSDELLSSNILIAITSHSSEWANIDLSQYNLEFKGDIALSLEWVKSIGIHQERFNMEGGKKSFTPKVYFNLKMKKGGCMYWKQGPENKWLLNDKRTPSIYLTVQELK